MSLSLLCNESMLLLSVWLIDGTLSVERIDVSLTRSTSLCVPVVLGKVRSAVGSAQLLMSQKFQQFQGLCEQNLVSVLIEPTSLIGSVLIHVQGIVLK